MQVARPEDNALTGLLEKFVCVRVVQANGIDLSLFQFDSDLTFAAFFLNADRTVYGRYGTRTAGRSGKADITMPGFVNALEGALELHAGYPANKASLAAKTGPKPVVARPEDYATLEKFKANVDFTGQGEVVSSCIHCHQVGGAEAMHYRRNGEAIPERVLFPWPSTERVGLSLTPQQRARVVDVEPGSAAAKAGFEKGDDVLRLQGQPILSVADVQWVLHSSAEPAALKAIVRRGGKEVPLELQLEAGWRRSGGLPWRMLDRHYSLGTIPGLALGGLRLRDLSDAERVERGLGTTEMALVSNQRGRGRSRRGRGGRSGRGGSRIELRSDDVVVAFDGMKDRMAEADVLAHSLQKRKSGDKMTLVVLRGAERVELTLALR